jgi:hypothetical protein
MYSNFFAAKFGSVSVLNLAIFSNKASTCMLKGMKKDLNQSAFSIVQQTTGETIPEPIDEKKKAAQESGRRGGLIGGAVRASRLTPKQRSEIAKKAAAKRWS